MTLHLSRQGARPDHLPAPPVPPVPPVPATAMVDGRILEASNISTTD